MKPATADTDSCQVFESSVGRKALYSLLFFAGPLSTLRMVRFRCSVSVRLVGRSLYLQSGYSADP